MKTIGGQRGFSLVEIMIAITIMGIVAAIVTTNVRRNLDEAKVKTAKTQMRVLESALAEFYRVNGFYPSTDQGLNALVEAPTAGRIPKNFPSGGFLEKKRVPLDPWENEFKYICDDSYNYEILSLGADAQEGGEGINADISSKDL
jgi:general secretion pathway protein G